MIIAGFDEVGRGAWAGPLCVAGVSADKLALAGLKDSKRYSPNQRADLYKDIVAVAKTITICWYSARNIDTYGLGQALRSSFTICAAELSADQYVVDGTVNYLDNLLNSYCEPKADERYPAVAAASIVAKHLRDSYMKRLHILDTRYGFDRHVGYGTAFHRESLKLHGAGPYHRLSFNGVKI